MTVTTETPTATARLLAGARQGSIPPGTARLELHLGTFGPLPDTEHRHWPEQLLGTLAASGLTGCGGAAFPTAAKVDFVRSLRRRPVVVANVMEGEPASAKDRVLATTAPHLILDGAELVARALGAAGVRICVPAEYAEAGHSLTAALDERTRVGLVRVPTTVEQPPGGYVAGEESALVRWLDGGPGRPQFRPQRPAVLRIGGRPALVDNAETLAQVALIARRGAEWFRSAGLPESPGTRLVTTSGALRYPGVLEVPLGTPLSRVLARAGAEPLAGVLLGGYGGTFVAPENLDVPLAPAPLAAIGANLGTGVVVALGAAGCPLAETARIVGWMADQSAGQCGPCVFGLASIAGDLEALVAGHDPNGAAGRLSLRLGEVDGRGACRHPDGVVRLVRSALAVFSADVARHRAHGPCPGVGAPSVLAFPNRGTR